MARDAYETKTRGQELQDDEFMRRIRMEGATNPLLRDDEVRRNNFINNMIIWRTKFRAENDFSEPREKDLGEELARALEYGDADTWSPLPDYNKFRFELEEGEKFVPFDLDEQPYEPNRSSRPLPKEPPKKTVLAVPEGYTVVTDGTKHARVKNSELEQRLKENPTWRKAEGQ
jgi:hypothetical protein